MGFHLLVAYLRFFLIDIEIKSDSSIVLTGKIYARKSSYDSDSSSLTVASSGKVLVPGSENGASSASTDQVDPPGTVSEEPKVIIIVSYNS